MSHLYNVTNQIWFFIKENQCFKVMFAFIIPLLYHLRLKKIKVIGSQLCNIKSKNFLFPSVQIKEY